MAIPKKIHWCWLSGDPLPVKIQDCINSWKRVMPDYEIVLWDKQRFDIHSVKFVADACNARKWAFAADYIRLYALLYRKWTLSGFGCNDFSSFWQFFASFGF